MGKQQLFWPIMGLAFKNCSCSTGVNSWLSVVIVSVDDEDDDVVVFVVPQTNRKILITNNDTCLGGHLEKTEVNNNGEVVHLQIYKCCLCSFTFDHKN